MASVDVVASPMHWYARAAGWARARAYALSLGAISALLLMCAGGLWLRYDDALAQGQRRVENLTNILADHLRRSVQAIDATLVQLNQHSQRVGGPNNEGDLWTPLLVAESSGLTGVGSLSILDKNGTITRSTIPGIVGQSRRDHYLFQHLSSQLQAGLVADPPFRSPINGHTLIPLGRRLLDQQGQLVGIAVATLEPDSLRKFYRSIDVGPDGIVWVLHPAGHVLFREFGQQNNYTAATANPVLNGAQSDIRFFKCTA